ncbi:hypothetical protein EI94DRAFT_582509 [Lactarius quietus]|nr:hypothetical protein EI94DRAFT_582509 [Lactarius quietus]
MEGTLARHKKDEAIRAASQLPYTWAEMLDLLTSNMASCTVLRLAIRLSFAAYILHPQLSGTSSGNDIFASSWMIKVVRTYLSRSKTAKSAIPESNWGDVRLKWNLRDRITFAMILVLYSATTHAKNSPGQNSREFPGFLPEIVYLTRILMHSDCDATTGSALFPLDYLDGAQIVLLFSGEVVPWSWSVWNDPRLADSELMVQLTAAWICHMDTSCTRMRWMRSCDWRAVLLRASKSGSRDAAIAITQLLSYVATSPWPSESESTSPAWSNLLLRSCWLTAQLLDPYHSWHVAATPTLMKSLCCIFVRCMMDRSRMDVQDAIIGALTHVDVSGLQDTIERLLDDKHSEFLLMLEGAFQQLINAGAEPQASSILSTTQPLRLMMNFLTLCCNASLRLSSEVSISALLSTMATWASKFNCSRLICHILTTFSTIGDSRSNNPRTQNRFPSVGVNEIPWEAALSFPRSDLLVASCLASCVLAVNHLGRLPTSATIGIWEYLSDALLLILADNYVGDEELLGLLVTPTLCEALGALLRQTRGELVAWTQYSPWAKGLCAELHVLLEGDEETKTRRILKKRMLVVGRRLLEIVGSHVDEVQTGDDEDMKWECVYYKGHVVRIVGKER